MTIPRALLDYTPLIPPVLKNHLDFTESEAEQYYKWFLANVDSRADYLRNYISLKQNIPQDKLDFSLDSLIIIWEWFLSVALVEKVSGEELENVRKRYEGVPQPMFEHLVEQNSLRLSTTTEYILFDIGMYAAKLFTRSYPCLKWKLKLKPKRDVNANLPVIIGFVDDDPDYEKPFYPELNPVDLVRTPAMKLIRDPSDVPAKDDLFGWCKMWVEWIPRNN